MTRREELENTARTLVRTFEFDVEISLHERDRVALSSRITSVLLQVEREVWEKAIKEVSEIADEQVELGNTYALAAVERIEEWCRAQQKELEP